MNARQVRVMLIILILVIFGVATASFNLVQKNIENYATTISSLNAEAESGDLNLQTLRSLEQRLKTESSRIRDVQALVAEEVNYGDRVVNDITKIARESGVSITGYEFINEVATPSTQPVAAAPTEAPTTPTTPLPAGITKKSVTITIGNPLPYDNLMKFLSKLETNKMQLQIGSVSMTKDKDNLVSTTQSFTIDLYVRAKVAS